MRVVCTGMSGTDRLRYVRLVTELAQSRGKQLAVYDVKEIMFRIAADRGQPVEEETILDASASALAALRAAALEHILRITEDTPNYILATHALFRWRHSLIPGFDVHYLNAIQPDLYVTITDTITEIKRRLDAQARWRPYSYQELLTWRDEETFVTEMMANFQRKPHALVARDQPPETLYRLIFAPETPKLYRSYPISHIIDQPELMAQADELGERLAQYFIVFDPMAIKDLQAMDRAPEGEGGAEAGTFSHGAAPAAGDLVGIAKSQARRLFTPEEMAHLDDQTVARDYKLIAQSDIVVVYYPTTVLSAGVISEMIYAITNGKRLYAIWLPEPEPSPFFSYYCSAPPFRSIDALFDHFDQQGLLAPQKPPEQLAALREARRRRTLSNKR